jgi:hypothetical protein
MYSRCYRLKTSPAPEGSLNLNARVSNKIDVIGEENGVAEAIHRKPAEGRRLEPGTTLTQVATRTANATNSFGRT